MANCKLAAVSSLEVYYIDGYHIIIAEGQRHSEWEVPGIVQLPIEIYPPQFRVELCGEGPKKGTSFKVSRAFRFGEKQDQLTIHTAEGPQVVSVQSLADKIVEPLESESAASSHEIEGKSYNMSFEEAYDNAVSNFMEAHPMPGADIKVKSELLSVRSEHGGFAPVNVMTVKIKAMYAI